MRDSDLTADIATRSKNTGPMRHRSTRLFDDEPVSGNRIASGVRTDIMSYKNLCGFTDAAPRSTLRVLRSSSSSLSSPSDGDTFGMRVVLVDRFVVRLFHVTTASSGR